MITDVTLNIGGLDLTSKLSTYNVKIEYSSQIDVTTMDGTEHFHEFKRPILSFKLIPLTDDEAADVFQKLRYSPVTVTYTNQWLGTDITAQMRVGSNLESAFGIRSMNGNRYYKGGEITLRQITVI